jgi:hypothetical protein
MSSAVKGWSWFAWKLEDVIHGVVIREGLVGAEAGDEADDEWR